MSTYIIVSDKMDRYIISMILDCVSVIILYIHEREYYNILFLIIVTVSGARLETMLTTTPYTCIILQDRATEPIFVRKTIEIEIK